LKTNTQNPEVWTPNAKPKPITPNRKRFILHA